MERRRLPRQDVTRHLDVTEVRIERYKADRLAAKTKRKTLVTPATLNRELATMKRAFRLAVEQKRLSTAPTIKLLRENNARQGFVEPAVFESVVGHLPAPLNELARFAYLSGWRKSEVMTLEWADVDRDAQRVTLRRERSKTGEPRILSLVSDLAYLIERQWRAREFKTVAGETALSPYVFHRRGHPVVDLRKRWAAACKAAGVLGLLFHDLRRSCVRNLERSGVSQAVAMQITGHKTISVYQRYRIINEDDRRHALETMQAAIKNPPAARVTPIRRER